MSDKEQRCGSPTPGEPWCGQTRSDQQDQHAATGHTCEYCLGCDDCREPAPEPDQGACTDVFLNYKPEPTCRGKVVWDDNPDPPSEAKSSVSRADESDEGIAFAEEALADCGAPYSRNHELNVLRVAHRFGAALEEARDKSAEMQCEMIERDILFPLRERAEKLRKAAVALVDQLDAVHSHPTYESVWTLAYVHGGEYSGPKYEDELAALRAAIQEGDG